MHQHNIDIDTNQLTRDDCLQLLMSYVLEPQLPKHTPVFIYDYPTSQAALATIRYDTPPVAERFEVYLNSIELANGFHELTDVDEQKKRFLHDQQTRIQHHKASVSIDQKFLSCLPHLPPCSGVALGIDRLLMLQLNTRHIREVISFDWPSL